MSKWRLLISQEAPPFFFVKINPQISKLGEQTAGFYFGDRVGAVVVELRRTSFATATV